MIVDRSSCIVTREAYRATQPSFSPRSPICSANFHLYGLGTNSSHLDEPSTWQPPYFYSCWHQQFLMLFTRHMLTPHATIQRPWRYVEALMVSGNKGPFTSAGRVLFTEYVIRHYAVLRYLLGCTQLNDISVSPCGGISAMQRTFRCLLYRVSKSSMSNQYKLLYILKHT